MSEPAAAEASPASFADALAAMPDGELAALLRQRPDAAVPPPADFDVLASRLSSQHSVSRVAETVDQFVLDVLEALVVASGDEDELVAFCRVPIADIRRATDDRGVARPGLERRRGPAVGREGRAIGGG